jgi:hypothetical protein
MTATGKSVTKHPAKDDINERLLAGESVEAVAAWLRAKFGTRKEMWVNKMTLQAYRKHFLNLDSDVLRDLKLERRKKVEEERKRRALEVVHSSDAYKTALVRGAETAVRQIEDTGSRLEELFEKVNERIKILETQKISHLNDKVIAEYIRLLKDVMKDWFEMQQKLQDNQQTNIDIDVRRITGELKVIKNAIRETITENCADVWPIFCEKLKQKLENARMIVGDEEEEALDGPVNIHIRA